MVENESNKWLGPLKGPHKAVTEAKEVQIKTSLYVLSLGNNNNHPKEAKVIKALLKFESGTAEKRGTNTN
jgi:hypothetical protein